MVECGLLPTRKLRGTGKRPCQRMPSGTRRPVNHPCTEGRTPGAAHKQERAGDHVYGDQVAAREGTGVERGFQRYLLPPSKAESADEAEGCQKLVYEHTLTLEEFPGWAPWSWLLPWRVGPKSNNLETQAGITDFHVFLLGRQVIMITQHPFCMGRHFRKEQKTERVGPQDEPHPHPVSCLPSRPACATTQTTDMERENRGEMGEHLSEGPRSERHEAQRWLTVCTSFRGQLPEDHKSQRLS